MSKKGGNPQNLVPFKQGEDERRNVTNGNAGSQSLKAILDRLLLKQINVEDLEGQTINVTAKEAIALNMIVAAVTAEDENIMLKAARQVFENTDPITKDLNVNLAPKNGGQMSPEQYAALKQVAEFE